MAKKPLPSPEVLRQLLRYEPETGKLFWKERGVEWFKDECPNNQRAWNNRWTGVEAFTNLAAGGYKMGAIFYQKLYAHRVIWAMINDEWPSNEIDHINGDKTDNRIGNLRSVSSLENSRNICLRSDNSSGHHGIHWDKRNNKWVATIVADGVRLHLGRFLEIDDAIAARQRAELDAGYHANHGRVPP